MKDNLKAVKVNISWKDDAIGDDLDGSEEYYVTDEFDRPSYVFIKFPVDLMDAISERDVVEELEDLYGGKIEDIAIINPSSRFVTPRMKTLIWTEHGLVGA